jgi:hypothetical protein
VPRTLSDPEWRVPDASHPRRRVRLRGRAGGCGRDQRNAERPVAGFCLTWGGIRRVQEAIWRREEGRGDHLTAQGLARRGGCGLRSRVASPCPGTSWACSTKANCD